MNKTQTLLLEAYKSFKSQQYHDVIEKTEKVLKIKYDIDALILNGIAYFHTDNLTKAEQSLKLAIKERPVDTSVQMYLLEIYSQTNQNEEGIKLIQSSNPSNDLIKNAHIKFLQINGHYTSAIKLAKSMPENIFTIETLAWNYELTNDLEHAGLYSCKGIKLDATSFKCNLVKAKLKLRNKNYQQANKAIKKISKEKLSCQNQSIYYSVKAQIKEKQKKFKKAFKYYTLSNSSLKQTKAYEQLTGQSFYSMSTVAQLKQYYQLKPQFKNLTPSKQAITFMLGLPRSGTTLLENILNSHSEIQTIEEKPTIDSLLNNSLDFTNLTNTIKDLTVEDIKKIQKSYVKARNAYCSEKTKIVIDKMPLNIIHIGLLYRIFPNAKFIISTRDLRDTALSCYFQNFKLNDAMVNFLDWEQTKHYLSSVKQLGDYCQTLYPLNTIIVPYERLVIEPFCQVKKILKFMNLDWQNSMLNYREKITGKNILTPSYTKVSEKITTSYLNKWHNYRTFVNFNFDL